MEIGPLSNPSEIAALKLMKKLADIYFTRVTQSEESTFSLSPRQIALWQSQMEDHTSNWLGVVSISGLGQTMNGSLRVIFMETMMYHVSVLFVLNIGITWVLAVSVVDATHCKRVKYEAKCAYIGYDFLSFSFSSFGELEKDVVNLLKRIRKFYVTKEIGARVAVHIFNSISFAIAKGVGAQFASRLPLTFKVSHDYS
nr:hypothetical protein [Tanacetum cinerariifolium]